MTKPMTRARIGEVRSRLAYINALVAQGQDLAVACDKAGVTVAEYFKVGGGR